MGKIIQLLIQGLKFGGPAAIGYVSNDFISWMGGLPVVGDFFKKRNPDGSVPISVTIVAFLILGLGFYLILKMISGKKKGGLLMLAIAAAYAVDHAWGNYVASLGAGFGEYHYATLILTLTTGAAVLSSVNTTYVPKYFFYTAATQLTGVKITVQGDGVIFDSDANGLTHCGVNRLQGQVTNTYLFRLANGFISNKNVLWEFTNSAAQTPGIYVDSDETPAVKDRMYLQLLRQPALGPGGTDFSDFATLSFPSMAATDYANVLFVDGTQQTNMARNDLQALLMFTQNIVNTPIYQFDNWGQRIKRVNFQATATQTAYVQRWAAPLSDGMLEQAIIAKG